jgi:predicted Fe-S protein YdhL (DUF1289 family)
MIPSPCIRVCEFDSSSTYCVGCFRTSEEMRDWYVMSDEQKQQAYDRISGLTFNQ